MISVLRLGCLEYAEIKRLGNLSGNWAWISLKHSRAISKDFFFLQLSPCLYASIALLSLQFLVVSDIGVRVKRKVAVRKM